MLDSSRFLQLRLLGSFIIVDLEIVAEPMVDAIGRRAVAITQITGRELRIRIAAGMSTEEESVTLYHEILEAITVGSSSPPASVLDFNEGDFERAGYAAHERFGAATPETLNRMLQYYGFREE